MLSIFITFFLTLQAHAYNEVASGKTLTASSAKSGGSAAVVELNACKPKDTDEEAFAQQAAERAGLSQEELLARLIYSESLSTGYWNGLCSANSDTDIMTGIGWGVMNRVAGKAKSNLDPYAPTIFGKNQFRTSFSGKKANPFAEAFLCPLKSASYLSQAQKKATAKDLYKKAQDIAGQIIRSYESGGIAKEYKGITNFFYPHSEFFGEMRPGWAKDADPNKNRGYMNLLKVQSKPCVEFYNLK